MQYSVISADDHLQEAPHCWTSRMSAQKWGGKVPQVVRQEDGADRWSIYGRTDVAGSAINVAGAQADRNYRLKTWDEVPPETYDPARRIEAMAADGVDVHSLFGNVSGNAGNTFSNPLFDEEFRLECIRAYNDYQVEEFAEPYPGRFLTMAVLPMWDPEKAVGEFQRAAGRGIKGVSFAFPQQFGYPHLGESCWYPLWDAIQESSVPLNFHVGAGITPDLNLGAWAGRGFEFLRAEASLRIFSMNTTIMSTIIYSGIPERFPDLRIVSAESGLGWVPYFLEFADYHWERGRLWESGMKERPSALFERQCYVTFWFETLGVKMRDLIGIDRLMWQSDFPHPTCTYPDSQRYIASVTEGMTPEEKHKVLVGNAAKLYRLDT